jgi:hypothetical protein
MSAPSPREVVESARPEAPVRAVSTTSSPPAGTPFLRRPSVERIVLGLLLAAAGASWLLDEIGVSVPWRSRPPPGSW